MLTIAPKSVPLPKYKRLQTHLLEQMKDGKLVPGQSLPTEQELAVRMDMARNTVRQALADLERQGLIQRVRGKGTFVHEDAARQLFTSPNLGTIALIVPESRTGFYPSLLRGVGTQARAFHGQVTVIDSNNDLNQQADVLIHLLDQQINGVVIVPTYDTPAHHLRPLQRAGIPVVLLHRPVDAFDAPLIAFDGYKVGRMAARAMLDHAHQRIAFFGSSRGGMTARYLKGLRDVLNESGLELAEQNIFFGDTILMTPEHERAMFASLQAMMAGEAPPTAIMASFDATAETLYMQLGRLGKRVPQDVSLISFGGTYRDGPIQQALAGILVDEELIGKQAVQLLNAMHLGKHKIDVNKKILMDIDLYPGETLARPGAGPGGGPGANPGANGG